MGALCSTWIDRRTERRGYNRDLYQSLINRSVFG